MTGIFVKILARPKLSLSRNLTVSQCHREVAVINQGLKTYGNTGAMLIARKCSKLCGRSLLILGAGSIVAAFMLSGETLGQQPQPAPYGGLERCQRINDAASRLHCYESLTTKPDASSRSQSNSLGTWRLVRTPNPVGGADAVSIMQTADVTRSDIDLAGLTLRCGETNTETLIVLTRPFPPRAHPKVTVAADGKSKEFTTTVVPPGAALLLPAEAASLATGPWQSSAELAVEVDDESPIRGVVSLKGLGPAYRVLIANCRQP